MTASLTTPRGPAVDRLRAPSARRATIASLAAWAALVVGSRIWGLDVVRRSTEPLYVDAVPFYGRWSAEWSWRLLLAAGVLVAACWWLPAVAARVRWRTLLAVVAVAAVAVSMALAFVEPPGQAWRNIEGDYGTSVQLVDEQGPGGFLRDYAERQVDYPTHLSAHPPGMVMLLWAEAGVGLGSTAAQVATAMAGVAAAAVAALVALAELAGRRAARAAAPFLVLAPAAVWHTNADVVFGGFALAGVALVAVASGRSGRRSAMLALGGGALLGVAMLLSHGLALMALPVLAVVVHRRRWSVGALAAVGALLALIVPALWGYSWLAGLASTKDAYDRNLARVRPYGYFVVANLAAFAVAVGPATAVALARLRSRATWVLVGGGLAAVVAADVSGLSLAETERIWQPFMPLVLLATACLGATVASARRWLVLQAAVTLLLVTWLRSPW